MSSDGDPYDLHREINLRAVERIIYIPDTTKAELARNQLLAGNTPGLGNHIGGANYDLGIVLEKKEGSRYSNAAIPNGSELWLDGEKIWPSYIEPRIPLQVFCWPSWQGLQTFGYSIALADENITNTIAIGCPGDGIGGSAGAYKFIKEDKSIELIGYGGLQAAGFSAADQFGSSIDVSYDGTVIAVGSHQHNVNYCKQQSGYVVVRHLVDQELEFTEFINTAEGIEERRFTMMEKKWVNKGQIIGGEPFDRVGFKVKLSQDGNTLAISASHQYQGVCSQDRLGNDTPRKFHKGSVRVYTYDATNDEWVPKGSILEGVEDWEGFGVGLDMTPDGDCIVVGSPYYQCPWGARIGRAQVFKYDSGDWKRVGRSITPSNYNTHADWAAESHDFLRTHTDTSGGNSSGTESPSLKEQYTNSKFGWAVAINGDGTRVAVSSPYAADGANAISVYGWNIDTEFSHTDNQWSGVARAVSTGQGALGYDIDLNDAGNLIAFSNPSSMHVVSDALKAAGAGKVQVSVIDEANRSIGVNEIFYTAYGPGAGSFMSRVNLSPSGRYIAMGAPYAPDRSDPNWDYFTARSAPSFGAVQVCDLIEVLGNMNLTVGGTTHNFSNMTALTAGPAGSLTALTEDDSICSPDKNPEPPIEEAFEEEPGSEAEEIQKTEDPEPEDPAKDPPGSEPEDVGEPEIVEVEEDDGTGSTTTVKKQVYVTEEKKVVYIDEHIDTATCACEISSGKKNKTRVSQTYTPPENGVLIKKDGTSQTITKNVSVSVPPGGTTFVRRPRGKKRKRAASKGYECPFVENWNPQTHYDCKFYDPDRPKPSTVLGGKTDRGTFNSSKTAMSYTATKRSYVTKENNPPNGKVNPVIYEVGDTVIVNPGETVYQQGGNDDDAGYEGGSYTTDSGKEVSPSNVLKRHDSGRINNTDQDVIIQKEPGCTTNCDAIKVQDNGSIIEIDLRSEDITLKPGETLFRGSKKQVKKEDPAQKSAEYTGGTYTNDNGSSVDPSAVLYENGTPSKGSYLSKPDKGTKNSTTEDTEYIATNNAVIQRKNGTIEKNDANSDGTSRKITLSPGDTIFEDEKTPTDRSSFPIDVGAEDTVNGVSVDSENLLGGGGSSRKGVSNNTNTNSNVNIPIGHKAVHINENGETTIVSPGSFTLKPGEKLLFGSDNGVDNTGYTGTGELENEEDVGNIPMDKLLSGGNGGIFNSSDKNVTVQVPSGKKGTLIGPNNEIRILNPGSHSVPPGWKINTGDDNGVDNAGYTPGTEINGNDVSTLMDDPDEGVTNNTQEDICVPIATKEIEQEDGSKTTLLTKNTTTQKLSSSVSRGLMRTLMRKYNISPAFTNPAGVFRKRNPYTTIEQQKSADDCEPGYEKLKPGETMFRGKSNGIEDAEYNGGSTFSNSDGTVSSNTDAGSLVNSATSGLTNTSSEEKQINLPEGHNAIILDQDRRISVANGAIGKKVNLQPGQSMIIGENAGISDAGYSGTGEVGGLDISLLLGGISSGIKNTSGSIKNLQLGIGNSGLLLNRSTGEVRMLSGDNVSLPDGFELYEGSNQQRLASANMTEPNTPIQDFILSDIFETDSDISEGIENISVHSINVQAPSGKKSFVIRANPTEYKYLGGGERYDFFPSESLSVTLAPGDILFTGDDYQQYTLNFNDVPNEPGGSYIQSKRDLADAVSGTYISSSYYGGIYGNPANLKANTHIRLAGTPPSPRSVYTMNVTANGQEIPGFKESLQRPSSSLVEGFFNLWQLPAKTVDIDVSFPLRDLFTLTMSPNYDPEVTFIDFSVPGYSTIKDGDPYVYTATTTSTKMANGSTINTLESDYLNPIKVLEGSKINYDLPTPAGLNIIINGATGSKSGSFTVTENTEIDVVHDTPLFTIIPRAKDYSGLKEGFKFYGISITYDGHIYTTNEPISIRPQNYNNPNALTDDTITVSITYYPTFDQKTAIDHDSYAIFRVVPKNYHRSTGYVLKDEVARSFNQYGTTYNPVFSFRESFSIDGLFQNSNAFNENILYTPYGGDVFEIYPLIGPKRDSNDLYLSQEDIKDYLETAPNFLDV